MAVWGTPVAREDDAERAVRAGLDLVAAVAALGEEAGAAIRARAGVATGEAAVTIGAQGEGMVAGDLVNTAARVQSVAEPGTVCVNDATRRASAAAIAYDDAGSHELKGKAEPLHLHRALEVTAARGGAFRSSSLEPPFVGREREFRLVKELFHDCDDERTSRLLTVTGIAGIGKSRLAWEFEKYADGLVDTVWWHRGRCLAYGEGVSYWALGEMVRMRARIAEDDPPADALAKLQAALSEAVPDEAEAAWIEPRLAHLLALGEPQAFERQDLFAAWRVFFERLAAQGPVVLVFEDLQWADASLLDFVEHLLDWSRAHPIFVLALTRPELNERRPGWGSGARSSTALTLDPLSDQAMQELLARFVPGLPDELVARILERSQGVPLYAVETVRMLLDRGVLASDGDRFAVVGPIDQLEVPETLHALVAARIDDLSVEERLVVQDASVLGKTFTLAGLVALSGRSPNELEARLRSLVRKEVLSVEADPRSPERGQYGFLQDLLQRIAYETLARADRRIRHLAAARHLESVLDAEAAEVVAAHYLDAYRADPNAGDADEIRAQAADALARGGRRAASLGAHEEAVRALVQAAELVDDRDVEAQLLTDAADADFAGGRWLDSVELYERAAALLERTGLSHRAARLFGQVGVALWMSGDLEAGANRIAEALDVLADEEPDADIAMLVEHYARLSFFLGDFDTASERIERALEIADALVLPELLIDALNTKNLVLLSEGRVEEPFALLKRAVEIGRANPPGRAFIRALYNLSYTMQARDRYEDALEIDRESIEVCRRRGERMNELMALGHSAYSLLMLGRWDESMAFVDALPEDATGRLLNDRAPGITIAAHRGELAEARRRWNPMAVLTGDAEAQMRAIAMFIESELLLAEGRGQESLAVAREGLRLSFDNRFSLGTPQGKHLLANMLEAALEVGDREAAEEALGLVDLSRPVERRAHVTGCVATARGRLAALDGDCAGAELYLREALAAFGVAQMAFKEAQARYYLGRELELLDELARARSAFVKLRARPWIERVDAVGAPVSA